MKRILALAACFAAVVLTACDKADTLPVYTNGATPVLTASTTSVAPAPADSNSVAITFNWTNPGYATDSNTYKYIIQIDSATKNFASPYTVTVSGKRSTGIVAKDLNTFLVNRGYAFGTAVTMQARVVASYANNNERLVSDPVTIKMTPYKVPPKVPLPAAGRLFIVGDASTFGWSNDAAPPAFPAAREFARLDETTWSGIFYLNGSGGYKLLQTQGVWDTQFHMVNGGTATAGSFVQENADPTFPSPAAAGWYKITLDFQQGTYTVTPVANALPQQLFITGDATSDGWTNSPSASQKFTRLNSVEYEISMNFSSGKYYKFLSNPGNWQPQFGGSSATGGSLGANYGSGQDPDAVPTPAAAGMYKVRVNFATNKYTVTP